MRVYRCAQTLNRLPLLNQDLPHHPENLKSAVLGRLLASEPEASTSSRKKTPACLRKKKLQGRLHISSSNGTGSPGEITTQTGDQLLGLRQADSLAPAGELDISAARQTPRTNDAIINDSLSTALEAEPRPPTSQLSETATTNVPHKRYFLISVKPLTN